MADIESLLAATVEAPPCGLNLEYDPRFRALEEAARGKAEQRIGDSVVPAEQPDWGEVRQQAEALLAASKDLRIAVLLLRALTRVDNLAGLRDGLKVLHGLLERYWEQVHPVPDPHDPEDIVTRTNTLAPLVDPLAVLSDVRGALVVPSGPHGRVSVRDILVAAGRQAPAPGETVLSESQIGNAITSASARDPESVTAARECADAVDAIHALLSGRVDGQAVTDLRPLASLLKTVAQACAGIAAPPAAAAQEAHEVPPPAAAQAQTQEDAARTSAAAVAPGQVRSRDDAMLMLDAVCRYYERAEPGNPAPLLIRRAQRLMNKSFVEIMQDLAPDSLDQIRHITGLKNEEA